MLEPTVLTYVKNPTLPQTWATTPAGEVYLSVLLADLDDSVRLSDELDRILD